MRAAIALAVTLVSLSAFAGDADYQLERKSLCDTKSQVRDGLLTISADVRDGQLKIGQEASFRVHVLNGMNRALFDVNLAVVSKEFEAEVRPSAAWRSYPTLETVARGGARECFDVKLKRRSGVPDGAYSIGLKLVASRMDTKNLAVATVGLDAAQDLQVLPLADSVKIAVDGRAGEEEWGKAPVGSGFYRYVLFQRRLVRKDVKEQTRFRLSCDRESLYCTLAFRGGEGAQVDNTTLYLARSVDGKPLQVAFDRLTGKVTSSPEVPGLRARMSEDRATLECRMPLKSLGLDPAAGFRANVVRTIRTGQDQPLVTYWRGSQHSLEAPVVYGQFVQGK